MSLFILFSLCFNTDPVRHYIRERRDCNFIYTTVWQWDIALYENGLFESKSIRYISKYNDNKRYYENVKGTWTREKDTITVTFEVLKNIKMQERYVISEDEMYLSEYRSLQEQAAIDKEIGIHIALPSYRYYPGKKCPFDIDYHLPVQQFKIDSFYRGFL